MVDKLQFTKIEPQNYLSITSKEISIFSQKTTMESDCNKGQIRSKSESKESKIGNKITKSFLEKEKNYLKNPKDYDRIIEESCSNSYDESKEEIINETIQVNIYLLIDDKEYIKNVNVTIINKVTIGDLLKESIKMLNKLFEKEKFPIRLSDVKLSNYKIKPSKKNGKPDKDLPSLNLLSPVCETNVNKFSIVYEPSDILVLKDKKEGVFFKCHKCNIF